MCFFTVSGLMKISKFGSKLLVKSGISQLMDDLGDALSASRDKDIIMLGGGNPAHIREVEESFRASVEELLGKAGEFEHAIGDYAPPQGNNEFIESICVLLNKECGWQIGPKNVAITNGSQSAFFTLFNMFAGQYEDGSRKKILFPLAPEYIGYCDVGLPADSFTANVPEIEHVSEHVFKYHINFDSLNISDEIGAICVSRPTNPTGNVLTDDETDKLAHLAAEHNVPLIIDNAYGVPFPNIVFTEARSVWNEQIIVCMSLSKLGLPATRTGIVIANEQVISMISEMNAVMSLAPGSLGAVLATELVRSGEIIRLSREVICPFYESKVKRAMELALDKFEGIDFYLHKPEGTFFLWIWFKGLKITSGELYERLKDRGVLVVPGHYFFPGLNEDWEHKDECIRLNYAQDEETVLRGLEIIADEVKRA